MKIPVVPLVVATVLVVTVLIIFNSMSSGLKTFGPAQFAKLVDLEGIETEVTVAPDGTRLIAVASGDLWLFNIADGSRRRLTETPEPESSPAWEPDGRRLTFTRGNDTFTTSIDDLTSSQLLKENAASLSWSSTGRMTFVRDRTLWVTDAGGLHEHALFEPDANPEITIRAPRFSPDSTQVAYVKTDLGLQGEVWIADATNGRARAVVADRWAENPLDVAWLHDGSQLVYLTNRSGAYALWVLDLGANTLMPLTGPLEGVLLDKIGIALWQDRIFVPRHKVDSNIVISDGTVVAETPYAEFEPAASRDGRLVAYTIQKENKFEIWTAGIHGEKPAFRARGSQPRFSPNGYELVYTNTGIEGGVDLRKVDIRDGSSTTVTDAAEIDFEPDWSPDGRTIAFASNQGGTMALWTIPAVDGKRLRLNPTGYFPRFSPDGRFLSFWSQRALWTMDVSGQNARRVRGGLDDPLPAGWVDGAPKTYLDPEVNRGKTILPEFDVLPDGRLLTAQIAAEDTALWTVDLTYVRE